MEEETEKEINGKGKRIAERRTESEGVVGKHGVRKAKTRSMYGTTRT